MVPQNMCEDIDIFAETLGIGHPDELKFPIIGSSLLVIAIKTGEKPSIKPHLSKESRISIRVTEGINLPTNTWFDTKFLKDEVMADHHVVDHIFVDGACFVVHGPAGVDEFKLAISNEGPYLCLHIISLIVPPHFEEFHLNFHELSSGVGEEGIDN